jgi:hypothetical protein
MKICIVLYVISLLMGLMESFPFTVDVANLTINAVASYTISIFFGNSASRSHISLVFRHLQRLILSQSSKKLIIQAPPFQSTLLQIQPL